MKNEQHPIYDRNTLEFVSVAYEFCTFMETAGQYSQVDFTDKATKLLPLLYLKAALLPTVEPDEDEDMELTVTEEMYEYVRVQTARLLGEKDSYLETFHPDMPYSDAPIVAFISENLADVYQDTGNFVALFKHENEAAMYQAVGMCGKNFRTYWGQQLLNALKSLHAVRYTDAATDDDMEIDDNE